MRRVLQLVVVPVSVLGMLAGLSAAHPPLAIAPPVAVPAAEPLQVGSVTSLQELRDLRDRLQSELDDLPATQKTTALVNPDFSMTLLQQLQMVEIRLTIEESASQKVEEAADLAKTARALSSSSTDLSAATLESIYSDWQQAIRLLQEVEENSLVAETAAANLASYRQEIEPIAYRYDTARSNFLIPIAERSGLPIDQVRITVCNLERECRRLNGNLPPASPASLIKVPIAIAVMEKAARENIDLDIPVMVNTGNYTEDASDVWVGVEYPLRRLVLRTINDSSNIATNELIDFAGFDYINQVMAERGYDQTFVGTKLVGESIYPANAGGIPNTITTDDLTDMMVGIYNFEHEGDDVLLDALISQWDWKLGYAAIKEPAFWIGEKTGQNSSVLGTTVGFKVGEERYILSVSLDYSANEPALRDVISGVVAHVIKQGHL